MIAFVVDASLALSWCFKDEATAQGDALLERLDREEALAPAIWPLEVANVLALAERRGRLAAGGVARSIALLEGLAITIDDGALARAWHEILQIARSERLTVHDAAYLELAMRAGTPLATRDRALAEAAARAGVELLAT